MATEERKLITVLFADVVGSTALAGSNDPEVVRGVMGRYFERLTEIAESHGGTVEKFAGDAVMVVFGVPTVHDDDAERAVRAALDARDAVASMATELPLALAVRLGVSTGEAVTGARPDRQFMVSGDVVNVAARLQQGAAPGEVVVGSLTESLTRSVIEYQVRDPIEARGKPDQLRAFRALRPRTAIPTQARGIPGLHAPLVGRARELRLLVETFGRVVEDRRPHLFTLVGSGGVGKSRLVAEALAEPALAGAILMRGRCLPYGRGITYWPLVEMFDRRLPERVGPESEWATIAARLSVLLGLRTPAEAMPDVPGERIAREIAWAVRRYLMSLAASRPVIAVIDDLQWAEEPMAELVEQLTDRMGEAPVLVVAIARPELLELHPGWGSGKANSTTLTLDPLGREETGLLISRLLALEALPASLREKLVERSEGTPLYCEEFLRMLIEEGRLVFQDGRWTATAGSGEIAVPHSIQALLAARLDGLTAEEKAALQAASVVGERFGVGEVRELLGGRADGLETAFDKGLIDEGDRPDEARFRHLLIRDAAYASIPKARRADLHDGYARLLEGMPGAGQVSAIAAHHAERALSLSVEVMLPEAVVGPRARRAMALALAQAERTYERRELPALEVALAAARTAAGQLPDRGGPEINARIGIRQAQLLYSRNDYTSASRAVAEAGALAESAGLMEVVADARLLDLWIYSQAGERSLDNLQVLLERLLPVCRELGDERRALEGRLVAAYRHWSAGRMLAYVEELTPIAERLRAVGDEPQLAAVLGQMAGAEVFLGHTAAAEELRTEAGALIDRLGLQDLKMRMELSKGTSALLGGDPAGAEVHYRRLIAHSEEIGAAPVTGLRFLSYSLDEQGRSAEAAATLDRAIDLALETSDRWSLSEVHSIRARVAVDLGELELAGRLIEQAGRWLREGDLSGEAEYLQALGQVRAAQDRDEEAEAAYRQGWEVIAGTDFNWPKVLIFLAYAEFLAARARVAEAAPIAAELHDFSLRAGWRLGAERLAAIRGLIAAG